MNSKIKIGILRETKNPPDKRVALIPQQCVDVLEKFQEIELYVQPSDFRAFTNEEYKKAGIIMQEDLSHCDILIGIKEVAKEALLHSKSYIFFSHTAKKQAWNRNLLQTIIKNENTLIDYEYLTDKNNFRLVAFGRWAGMVGAYNGLIAFGLKKNLYTLKRAYQCHDYLELFSELEKVKLPPIKILISGGGRVANGAAEVLEAAEIKKVSPGAYLRETFDEAVYTQIDPWHYTHRKEDAKFDMDHFMRHPYEYESSFEPYTKITDLYLSSHYWDPRAPKLLTKELIAADDFKMSVVADITCDIGGSVESTIRVSTIAEPFYGLNKKTLQETEAFNSETLTVMSVDNLPGELPRDSSEDFGNKFIDVIFPHLLDGDQDEIIKRATIVSDGELTEKFKYLEDYVGANFQ